jgi:small conductance mechanosensitive channel
LIDFSVYVDQAMQFAPKIILAIIYLFVGLWIISILNKGLLKVFEKRGIEKSLRHFLSGFIIITLKILLIISVVATLGVQTTAFIAVVGALGLAVGLALQGSLGNFAGGVLIILFKPFKAEDVVEAQGFIGKIEKIEIFNTVMTTFENKTVFLPNGPLSNSNLVNYSREPNKRVDMLFGISYSDDIDKAKKIVEETLKSDKRVFKDPEPFVKITELADSSVNITARAWCKNEDYWGIKFDTTEKIKKEFDKKGVSIPFPQMDVWIKEHSNKK